MNRSLRIFFLPIFQLVIYVLALAGFFFWLLFSLLVIQEHVHAVALTPHTLSSLAQLFSDFSPFPVILAICCTITVGLIVRFVSLLSGFGEDSRAPRAVHLSTSVCLLLVSALIAALWSLDLWHLQELEEYGAYGENAFSLVLEMSLILYPLGASGFFFLFLLRRPLYAYLCFALPVPFMICIAASPTARGMLSDVFAKHLSLWFPRISTLIFALVPLFALPFVISHVRRRFLKEATKTSSVFSTLATLPYAVFSFACLGLIAPWYIGIKRTAVPIQRKAAAWTVIAFSALWIAIIIMGFVRYRNRRQSKAPQAITEAETP